MTGTATSSIKLDMGDGIAASAARQKHASGGEQRKMIHPADATKSVAWKRKQLRSGKPPFAGLTFIVDKPNGECRLKLGTTERVAIAPGT